MKQEEAENKKNEKNEKKIFSELKRKKDKQDFIKVYDLLVNPVFRFIYFKVGNEEEAKDLASATFLKAWNYVLEDKIKNFKTLKSLIYKIARNSVIDYYRKNSANIFSIDDPENSVGIVSDQSQNLYRDMEIKDEYQWLLNKIGNLKDEYRDIIILKYVEELSVGEIAEVLEKSKTNVRVLSHRALKALKGLIKETNGGEKSY